MKRENDKLSQIAEVFLNTNNFIVTAHERPDGDAVGSMLAVGHALKDQGKSVLLYAKDEIPKGLEFLPGSKMIENNLPDSFINNYCLLLLDCHEIDRPGPEGVRLFKNADKALVIDHHLGNGPCNSLDIPCYALIDSTACATAELCFYLFKHLNWQITKEIATCLYTAVLTDTGGFRYSNTNTETFELAKALVDSGADPYEIALNCFESKPYSKLKLLGLALDTLEVYYDGRLAIMSVTQEMFDRCGANESETDDFVSYARTIDTVEMAVLVKEARPGLVSVSLRSKKYVNVAEIANKFGGGGHFNAAGFRVNSTPEEVKKQIVAIAKEYLDKN